MVELAITFNGTKIAKLRIDDLPWYISAAIALLPRGTICACIEHNSEAEKAEIKKVMTRTRVVSPSDHRTRGDTQHP